MMWKDPIRLTCNKVIIDVAMNIDVVRNSEAIYNGTMYIKQATEYVAMGTGQWRLGGFTATAYILPQPK